MKSFEIKCKYNSPPMKNTLLHGLIIKYYNTNEIKTIYEMFLHGLWQLFTSFENHVRCNHYQNSKVTHSL